MHFTTKKNAQMANIWVSDGLEGCACSHQQAPVTYGILKDTQETQEVSVLITLCVIVKN